MRTLAAAMGMATVACGPVQPSIPSVAASAAHYESGVVVARPDASATTACAPAPASAERGRLRVVHDDRVVALRLISATYELDGHAIATRSRDQEIPDDSSALILDADVPTGCHVLNATLDYFTRFPTPWGYDYVFRVKSAHSVVLGPGGSSVRIVSTDTRGNVTTPIEERFEVRWEAP